MVSKTFAALFGGCLVSISVMLNIHFFLPINIEMRLLIGLLLSFPLWIAAMVWGYSCASGLQAWKKYAVVLFVSIAINSFFILG